MALSRRLGRWDSFCGARLCAEQQFSEPLLLGDPDDAWRLPKDLGLSISHIGQCVSLTRVRASRTVLTCAERRRRASLKRLRVRCLPVQSVGLL